MKIVIIDDEKSVRNNLRQIISRSLRTIQPIDFYHNFVENLVV